MNKELRDKLLKHIKVEYTSEEVKQKLADALSVEEAEAVIKYKIKLKV